MRSSESTRLLKEVRRLHRTLHSRRILPRQVECLELVRSNRFRKKITLPVLIPSWRREASRKIVIAWKCSQIRLALTQSKHSDRRTFTRKLVASTRTLARLPRETSPCCKRTLSLVLTSGFLTTDRLQGSSCKTDRLWSLTQI